MPVLRSINGITKNTLFFSDRNMTDRLVCDRCWKLFEEHKLTEIISYTETETKKVNQVVQIYLIYLVRDCAISGML